MSVGSLMSAGPLLLAIPVAAAAGAVTFLSPCVLPLVPGYLSIVTGLDIAVLEGDAGAHTKRIVGTTALGWTLCAVALGGGCYWLARTRPWANGRLATAPTTGGGNGSRPGAGPGPGADPPAGADSGANGDSRAGPDSGANVDSRAGPPGGTPAP